MLAGVYLNIEDSNLMSVKEMKVDSTAQIHHEVFMKRKLVSLFETNRMEA